MKALVIGGSRNIGYWSAVRLLEKGWTVTFLLRSPSVFDDDELVKRYVEAGTARLIKGDALVRDDVKHAWDEAAKGDDGHQVDLLVFTVGSTTPKFSITKGFTIDPPNLVTACLFNAICTMPHSSTKIITLSSTGVVHTSHAALPLLYKPLYNFLLPAPHRDKLGTERIATHCTGREWSADDPEPAEDIMGPGDWTKVDGFPEKGTLKDFVVVRPALLTDGDCHADKIASSSSAKKQNPYRTTDGELNGAYFVSRKDVAHFIVEDLLPRWDECKGKCISIAY